MSENIDRTSNLVGSIIARMRSMLERKPPHYCTSILLPAEEAKALLAEIARLRPMAESWESYEAAQDRKGSAVETTAPDWSALLADCVDELKKHRFNDFGYDTQSSAETAARTALQTYLSGSPEEPSPPQQPPIDNAHVAEGCEQFAGVLNTVEIRTFTNHPPAMCAVQTPVCSICGQIDVRIPRMGIYHVCPTPNQDGQQTPAPSGHAGLGTTGQSPSAVRSSEKGSAEGSK